MESDHVDFIISTIGLDPSIPHIRINPMLLEQDKMMLRNAIRQIQKEERPYPVIKRAKKNKKIHKNDIYYMVLLGQEILQVLDNIKLSTIDAVPSKKDFIAAAGRLFARNEEYAAQITNDLIRREDVSSTYLSDVEVLFLHCETRGVKHCRFGYIALKEPLKEGKFLIHGAMVMLIPPSIRSKFTGGHE
jgi:mannitol/fructose-specific phosphotransferase system IIA component (Ntr-type)